MGKPQNRSRRTAFIALTLSAAAVMPLSVSAQVAPAQSATTCRDLALLRLPGTLITMATEQSGSFTPPVIPPAPGAPPPPPRDPEEPEPGPLDLPLICRVGGVIDPAIQFEVWLPVPARG